MDAQDDDVRDVIKQLLADKSTRHAFGEPFTVGRTTVLPVAQVGLGGGGGGGRGSPAEASDDASGWGGGYGLTARPVGAFVITEDCVSWKPAWDFSRLALIAGAMTIALAVVLRQRRRTP